MEFSNEFRVSLPVEPAWELFNDVERIVPCMPGATLTEAEGDRYHGTVKVKVGPVTVQYRGVATFEERDEQARTVRIKAAGRDSHGQGNADAEVTVRLAADGDGTRVQVRTRLSVTGKAAQFGKSVMEDISRKLLDQFVDCLERRLAGEHQPEAEPAAAPATGTVSAPEPQRTAPPAAAPAASASPAQDTVVESIDLFGVARGALLRRLGPPAAAGALAALGLTAAWLWARRRCCRCGARHA